MDSNTVTVNLIPSVIALIIAALIALPLLGVPIFSLLGDSLKGVGVGGGGYGAPSSGYGAPSTDYGARKVLTCRGSIVRRSTVTHIFFLKEKKHHKKNTERERDSKVDQT